MPGVTSTLVLLTSLNPAAVAAGADIGDAVRIDGTVLSRSDLVGAATSVAERVAGRSRVAVLATPTRATVLAVAGCLIAGVPFVPVPADVGAAERRHILTDSGAQAWLGEKPGRHRAGLPHIPVRLHARSWHRYAEPSPDATALIMYTSGTTGPPKGVVVSRRAIAADIDVLAEAWQWTPEDTLVHGLPLYPRARSGAGLLGSLRIGNRFVHTGKPTPQAYARAVGGRHRCSSGCRRCGRGSPTTRDAARALAPARLLVSGSAPLPVPVFDAAGRAERAPARRALRQHRIADHAQHPGRRRAPAGLGGLAADRCRDPAGRRDRRRRCRMTAKPLGGFMFRARRCSTATSTGPTPPPRCSDADGWYRTGDVAVIDGDGMHRIVGRESVDLIKSGGFRVGAGEIETALLGHPGVREAAVVGAPDDDLGQRIVAFVVGDADPGRR